MQLPPGTRLAHYEIAATIGTGAMSEVYLARDISLNLEVAVKVVSAKLLATDADARARFEKEAQAAARLNHTNICRVYYYGVENGWPFYAMELIRGVTLQQVIDQRLRLSWAQILDMTVQSVRGLRHAAQADIANRDVKPANLMLGRDGVVRVVDFGLSTWLGSNPYLSDRGLVVGTPSYVSPEAIRRETVDWRSDQYSLGVTLFHLVTGHLPYDGDDAHLVMRMHLESEVPDLAERDGAYPPRLTRIIRRMMDKDPDGRFESYDALLDELDRVAEDLSTDIEDEIAFCELCRRNTLSVGSACRSCGATRTVHAPRYAQVLLTGYGTEEGRANTAEYLARSIGREPKVVERILEDLPFRLSNHLDFEQAVTMQRRLTGMGAEVEVVPIRDEGLPEPGERLPYGPLSRRYRAMADARPAAPEAPRTSGLTVDRARARDSATAWLAFAVGLVAGVCIGAAAAILVLAG